MRDFDDEHKDSTQRKYMYNFDFNVLRPYIIQSFKPFFINGSLLELGCFKGEFTQQFLPYFDDITCIEASTSAIKEARDKLGESVKLINSTFEEACLSEKYKNVILTDVIEHLEDPVFVLKKINDEWLDSNGRLFITCPNANAPSRQIAVKMGLLSHNTAVMPVEFQLGHRRTYTFDTLEKDVESSGLKIIHRSGVFFKPLANFQWDKLLNTDIISKEYLDGCYKLGQQYPDLCASLFLLCEKG